MKRYFTIASYFLFLGLASLISPLPAQAATVALATAPLATSTTTSVKPNVLLVLDDSGSMAWDHMPDDDNDGGSAVTWQYGYYGLRSSQCNEIYYEPSTIYTPPLDAAKALYSNSSFTGAWVDGFSTGAGTVNLNNNFVASQSFGADPTGQSAYYYQYTGMQNTQLQKNYNDSTNTFYAECHVGRPPPPSTPANTPPPGGTTVFSKRRLATTETTTIVVGGSSSTSVGGITVNGVQLMLTFSMANSSTSTVAANIVTQINLKSAITGYSASASSSTVTITGPTSAASYPPVITIASGSMTFTTDVFPDTTAANLTNFANWYSYYRTRMLMMKTAAGQAFSTLDQSYRVGLLRLSSSNAPTVALDTFTGTQRTNWYSSFYGVTPGGSTPLRVALSDAGRYYAGLLSGGVTDPMQYSCQQNFSIMSTDGYWNGSAAGYQLDGSTGVGNQDDTVARPLYDGATTTANSYTFTYTRSSYSKVTPSPNTCTGSTKVLKTQSQIGTCTKTTAPPGSCTPSSWTNDGLPTLGSTCNSTAAPAASAPVFVDFSQNTTGGSSDSLADVAMYYYQTDLRTPTLGNCTSGATSNILCSTPAVAGDPDPYNNVFQSATDKNNQQHMTTFTLGLGASGWMNYSVGYEKGGTNADYDAVRLGLSASSTVCKWQATGTTCNWPIPGEDSSGNGLIANIDDLWHAAVNGHGTYFSATNPDTLSTGLSNALASIRSKQGAAAAAATSTLNPVAGNNFAYVASYTTVNWNGNLEARGINTDTGVVNENASWCVENIVVDPGTCATLPVAQTSGDTTIYNCETPSNGTCTDFSGDATSGPQVCKVPMATACTGTMNAKVAATTDTRTIVTANATGTAVMNFDTAYATANPSYFNTATVSALSQWSSLDSSQQSRAVGANLLNYLRGQSGFENRPTNVTGSGSTIVDNELFRARSAILGDALESQPAFISAPVFSYPYPGYSAFKTAQAGRAGTVYMGTNDGMMHAFAADTGVERWAYVPSMVIPNMWKLADFNYSTLHNNFVNGSPITSDVCTANCTTAGATWKTILVAGLNGGGRGYYALDITNPTAPTLLWELTTTAGIGKTKDDDLGYSYGQPVITKKADGTWVVLVTSGYNNVSPGGNGDGKGYLYVLNANTGAIISKIATGVGSTTTPSGLAKIAGFNNEPPGNAVSYVYGGDLLGNVWRFDVNDTTTTASIGTGVAIKFATLFSDNAGANPQPITTTPVLGKIAGSRVVFIGTGKYLEVGDLTTTQTQTEYAIKDDNSGTTFVNPRSQTTLMVNQTMATNVANGTRSISPTLPVNFYTGRGWFVDFPESGERVNIDSQLVLGVLIVPTIVPSNTACSPGGHGWLNFLDYKTGGAVTSSGLVSAKYDSTIVGVNVLYIDGAPVVEVVTSTDPTPNKDNDVTFPPTAGSFTGKRTLWRELLQ